MQQKNDTGKYQKKISDQEKEINKLKKIQEESDTGTREINMALDAILASVAINYGDKAIDDNGDEIGWRIHLPEIDIKNITDIYEVHARRDQDGYTIGVSWRKQ